ncbi:MAG: MFS transporter [Planctomycetales bacterium]
MSASPSISVPDLTPRQRNVVLLASFLGWFCAGLQMGQMNLVARSATQDFIRAGAITSESNFLWSNLGPGTKTASSLAPEPAKKLLAQRAPLWLAWYNSAFLFGAAAGGLLFGRLADRYGRHPAMTSSIACYSFFAAAGYWATTPEKFLLLRFLSSMGVGGMWPVAVALASEAWGTRSRALLAGIIGAAGNLGIVLLGVIGFYNQIAPQAWRWVMLITASPLLLAVWVAMVVPESPAWRRSRLQTASASKKTSTWEIFHPPLLSTTIIGIILGMIPLLGNWGTTAWFIPWADAVKSASDPSAKAFASIMRAGGGAIGSFLGGGLATLLGRRTTYVLVSLATLAVSEFTFTFLTSPPGIPRRSLSWDWSP